MISRLLMGYLIGRLGRNVLLSSSAATAAVGLVMLPIADSPVVLGMIMVLIGLGLGIGQPMTMAWVANRSPRAERGTALGVRLTGNRAALVVVPVLIGALAGAAGVSIIFWVMALALGAGAIVAYIAPLNTKLPPAPGGAGGNSASA